MEILGPPHCEEPYVVDFIAVAAVRNPRTELKEGEEALTFREA